MDNDRRTREQQGERLKAARKAAGYRSAREAALNNDWPESTYRAHEKGTRTIGQDDADRYARRFRAAGAKTSAQIILFGPPKSLAPVETAVVGAISIPVLNLVSAGKLTDPETEIPVDDQTRRIVIADLGPGDFFALEVNGTSMELVSPDGSIVVINRTDKLLVSGKYYVFSYRGQTSYKVYRPGPPERFEPYSQDRSHEPIYVLNKKYLGVIGRVRRTVLDL